MEKQKRTQAKPSGRPPQSGDSEWRLDPSDVARHAQLRRRSEQRGPLGRVVRYSAFVLALAGAFAVYWNFDTLRQVTVEAPALSALFKSVSSDDTSGRPRGAPGNAVVETSQVAGTAAPTSVSTASNPEPPLAVAPTSVSTASNPEPPLAVANVEGHAAPSADTPEA